MSIKKLPRNKLGKTAKYYRDHPAARKKKAETDKKIMKRPEQKKKNAELKRIRRKLTKKLGKAALKGKDVSHTKKGLVLKKSSINRGSKSDTAGDRRARGGKKKKK